MANSLMIFLYTLVVLLVPLRGQIPCSLTAPLTLQSNQFTVNSGAIIVLGGGLCYGTCFQIFAFKGSLEMFNLKFRALDSVNYNFRVELYDYHALKSDGTCSETCFSFLLGPWTTNSYPETKKGCSTQITEIQITINPISTSNNVANMGLNHAVWVVETGDTSTVNLNGWLINSSNDVILIHFSSSTNVAEGPANNGQNVQLFAQKSGDVCEYYMAFKSQIPLLSLVLTTAQSGYAKIIWRGYKYGASQSNGTCLTTCSRNVQIQNEDNLFKGIKCISNLVSSPTPTQQICDFASDINVITGFSVQISGTSVATQSGNQIVWSHSQGATMNLNFTGWSTNIQNDVTLIYLLSNGDISVTQNTLSTTATSVISQFTNNQFYITFKARESFISLQVTANTAGTKNIIFGGFNSVAFDIATKTCVGESDKQLIPLEPNGLTLSGASCFEWNLISGFLMLVVAYVL